MTRGFAQLNGGGRRGLLVLLAASAAALAWAPQAGATSLTPGDVVVERDGNGGVEALTSSATPVHLDEFGPLGGLAASLALPTEVSGSNKPLLDSGGATSDGDLTLSGNGECLLTVGIDAKPGTTHVLETKDTSNPRVVAVVNGKGEINTETALTNFANENNPRSATSENCKKLWVGGDGTKTTGGVLFTELAKTTGTQLNEDKNVRQVEVADNQLYVSADPEKEPITVATVGSGLPETTKTPITNLPFATPPEEPYAYSLLTLGLGGTPDTLYVADKRKGGETSAIVKYGLSGGKWVEHGSVEIPCEGCVSEEGVTGVTANDVNGLVTIYATCSGVGGKEGTLYRVADVSGVNGTLSGVPQEIAKAPTNEAFRGVAFAPGTTIGSGGTPPPAPSISAAESALPAALGDPTNKTMPITVEDPAYSPSELTVTVASSKESVAPVSGISVTGSGKERTLHVTPGEVGESKLTVTVEAPNGVFASTQIAYGVSEYEGDPSDRYYSAAADSGASIDVGGGYMVIAGDESNVLKLYHERVSGPPLKTWDFDSQLPFGAASVNIHGSARAGNTLYFVGGAGNTQGGVVEPSHDTIFAVRINGSGASTELNYVGSYDGLREDLIEWDTLNGSPLGLAASAASGQAGEAPNGFKIQGVEFAPGSSSEAYISFRSPLEPPGEGPEDRNLALVIAVSNFSSLFDGNPGTTHATFATPLEWNLGGLSIREIRANAEGEYLIIAGTANSSDTVFQLWGWDGETEDEPVLLNASIPLVAEGVWDSITATPDPIANGDGVELLQDNSKTVWYGPGSKDAEKGLTTGLQKSLGRLVTVEIPAPGTPNPPHLSKGVNPNTGDFTLRWKPAPTLRARFTLQHQNAQGGWSTIASALSKREYTFAAGNPEKEDTWTYRVKESNQTAESGYSAESEPIKVDKTPPLAPTASASRAPDYTGKGGWYKNSVTVSFTANGDPVLADGSPGSGVEPASLAQPQTFNTSGSHTACGTVADKVGNVSKEGCLTVQVDATPPSLEITCPASVLVGTAGVTATVTASDAYSGLASDPSGSVPINTSVAGHQTVTRTAISNVGLETTKSCTTQIVYQTPGAPALTAGATPNKSGLFTLGWSGDKPMQYLGLSYTLQHRNHATETWSTVTTDIEALSYEFSGAGEEEGTWVYRVQGTDPTHEETTEYSPGSTPVVVDKTPPRAPSASASRKPDYAGGGGWYKNSVEVSFTSNGDPSLSDGSPGSGVNPASIPASQTFSTSGSHAACGTVADNAGNISQEGCLTVQVDATPPSLEITCPASVAVGEPGVKATVTASDAYSGLASNPSGSVPINTLRVGPQTVTRTAVSNVGLETTKSCTTEVVGDPPELGRCVKVPGEVVGSKTVYHGEFTKNTCATVSKKHNGPYEFESGVLDPHFTSNAITAVTLETASRAKVTCSGETSAGEFTSPRTVGGLILKFDGCALAGFKCTTAHQAEGKIVTSTLEGTLGVYKMAAKPAGNKVGLELSPAGKAGTFMEFSCGGTSVSVKGSVIVPLTANKTLPTIDLQAKASNGKQKPENFVGGPKEILEASTNGEPDEPIGLTVAVTEENGEELEVDTVV